MRNGTVAEGRYDEGRRTAKLYVLVRRARFSTVLRFVKAKYAEVTTIPLEKSPKKAAL